MLNMYLEEIRLNNFRNYKSLTLSDFASINFLIGENAQGKSNFLEALFCLASGRSFRPGQETDLINWESDSAYMEAKLKKNNLSQIIEIAWAKEANFAQKTIKINKNPCRKLADLASLINLVLYSPSDIKIISESPTFRRRFIDSLTCQLYTAHFSNLLQYKRTLETRNKFLSTGKFNSDLETVYDEQLVELGSQIIQKRLETLNKFYPFFQKLVFYFDQKIKDCSITYKTQLNITGSMTTEQIKQAFKIHLKNIKETEHQERISLLGPHRDDLIFLINKKPARFFGSLGEQHTLALTLRLAQAKLLEKEKGDRPILLLDDCFSGLDLMRQKYIWEFIQNTEQVFITATVLPDFVETNSNKINLYQVSGGTISLRRLDHVL